MLPKADFIKTITAPNEGEGIIQTYMADLKIKENTPVTFRFYSAWEYQNPDFKNWEGFLFETRVSPRALWRSGFERRPLGRRIRRGARSTD